MPRRIITKWSVGDGGGAGRTHDLGDGSGAAEKGCIICTLVAMVDLPS
jgi:hypothetical protein